MPQSKSEKKVSLWLEDEFKEPSLYKVILHNDDYTTMEFVISVLVEIFRKSLIEAEQLMLTVHKSKSALVGMYTKEVAEMKVDQTIKKARSAGYPLLCTFEPAS